MKNCFTYMALVVICDKMTESIDNHNYCAGIFIDQPEAFDAIDHEIMINKLKLYGIHGHTLTWFSNYLNDRY